MSTIAQKLTRRVSVELSGKQWPIVFTHAVLLDIEAATGLDLMAGELDLASPTARAFRAVLTIAVRAAGCELQERSIGRLLLPELMQSTRLAIVDAWQAAMPEPEPPSAEDTEPPKVLSWIEAWAVADQDLGLTADEWLAITPRMAQELLRRRLGQIRNWELTAGLIIANNIKYSMAAPKKTPSPASFMLHPWPHEAEPEEPELTGEYFQHILSPLRKKA